MIQSRYLGLYDKKRKEISHVVPLPALWEYPQSGSRRSGPDTKGRHHRSSGTAWKKTGALQHPGKGSYLNIAWKENDAPHTVILEGILDSRYARHIPHNRIHSVLKEMSLASDEPKILETAQQKYLEIFNQGTEIESKLAEKMEMLVGQIFSKRFGLKTKKDVKILCAKVIIQKEIDVKKFVTDFCNHTSKLMEKFNQNVVDIKILLMALILHYLSERMHDFDQLSQKLTILNTKIDTNELLLLLSNQQIIEKEGDFYKINVSTLLK